MFPQDFQRLNQTWGQGWWTEQMICALIACMDLFADCDLPWLRRSCVYVLSEAGLMWIYYFRPCWHVNEAADTVCHSWFLPTLFTACFHANKLLQSDKPAVSAGCIATLAESERINWINLLVQVIQFLFKAVRYMWLKTLASRVLLLTRWGFSSLLLFFVISATCVNGDQHSTLRWLSNDPIAGRFVM